MQKGNMLLSFDEFTQKFTMKLVDESSNVKIKLTVLGSDFIKLATGRLESIPYEVNNVKKVEELLIIVNMIDKTYTVGTRKELSTLPVKSFHYTEEDIRSAFEFLYEKVDVIFEY